jgi:hypothetical protein
MTKLAMLVALLLAAPLANDPERDTNAVCKSACDGKGDECLQRCVMCAINSGDPHSVCVETCHENHVWGTTESGNCLARCFKRFETRVLACLKEGAKP